jgi:hypothetical protein
VFRSHDTFVVETRLVLFQTRSERDHLVILTCTYVHVSGAVVAQAV